MKTFWLFLVLLAVVVVVVKKELRPVANHQDAVERRGRKHSPAASLGVAMAFFIRHTRWRCSLCRVCVLLAEADTITIHFIFTLSILRVRSCWSRVFDVMILSTCFYEMDKLSEPQGRRPKLVRCEGNSDQPTGCSFFLIPKIRWQDSTYVVLMSANTQERDTRDNYRALPSMSSLSVLPIMIVDGCLVKFYVESFSGINFKQLLVTFFAESVSSGQRGSHKP